MLAKRTNRNTCGKQSGPDFFLTYTLCLEPLLFTLAGVRAVLFPDLARGHRTGRSTCCVISRTGPWPPNWQEYVLCYFQTWSVGTELAGVRAETLGAVCGADRPGH